MRHGAAVALRELLRSQAEAAAVEAPVADISSGWCEPGGEGELGFRRGGGGGALQGLAARRRFEAQRMPAGCMAAADTRARLHSHATCTDPPRLAAAGLRTLVMVEPEQAVAAAEANAGWLEDCIMLMLCVLALDRFADYVSDQVISHGS